MLSTGDIAAGRAHLDQVIAGYDPAEHRELATRFAQDIIVAGLSWRSWALWLLGYPDAALRDADDNLKHARDFGEAGTLMCALGFAAVSHTLRGNYAAAAAQSQELVALADEKSGPLWKSGGMMNEGSVLAMTGKASEAVEMLTSGIAASLATGGTIWLPLVLPCLARAHAGLGQFEQAWRSIDEAMTLVETTKETLWEAETHRVAGEIALMSPEPDAANAQACFERALTVARAQEAKSWELRAATSLARLWRDQGKRQEAHDLLAPVYGWFTEGFDTLDLKEARALLEELHA